MAVKISPMAPENMPYLRFCSVRCAGNIIETREAEHRLKEMPIEKFSADEYVIKSTGELKPYNHQENRSSNMKSIRDSMSKARAIINANFTGGINQLWVTLTYAENMKDTKRLYKDFKEFVRALRVAYGKMEYFAICEPQGRGAWHMHVLLKSHKKTLIIPKKECELLWGHGFCKVQRLADTDNVGAYISAYCSNMPNADVTSDKKYIKGGRLHLYPNGMNFYRASRGLVVPEWQKVGKRDLPAYQMARLVYEQIVCVMDGDTSRRYNVYRYRQYNMHSKQNGDKNV